MQSESDREDSSLALLRKIETYIGVLQPGLGLMSAGRPTCCTSNCG